MSDFLWIMGSAILDAFLGLVGVFSLWVSKQDMDRVAGALTAFAAGSLLGGAFMHLLPEAMDAMPIDEALIIALSGFVLFIFLEAYVHWHHCKDCGIHPFSYVIVAGDAVHNFLGGLVLAASYFVSVPLGIATLVAIIAHELPQQLGIFGALVKGGFGRNKAIVYSFAAQSTIVLGALVGIVLSGSVGGINALLVPFAAGNFIYIAAADLIPEMHKSAGLEALKNIGIFFLGLAFMWALKAYGGS